MRTADIDPRKDDDYTWSVWHNIFLSGESGILRFYLIHGRAEIGVGDVEINDGKPGS